jgi:LysR family transcriptional regulator, cyn operon transcriptional activator
MELRHLRYFVALAERLNFTEAAAQTHVTQSTLSHQVQQLETELGQPLFERTKRRVALTAAGELFLPKAIQALGEIDGGLALLSASAQELTGRLRVGTTPTFNIHVVPRVLAAFTLRHPNVRVSVDEDTAANIARRVATRKFDLAIAYHPGADPNLLFQPLCNEELVLVVGVNHPFGGRKRLRMIELHRRAMILPPTRFATRRMLDEAFASAGAEPLVCVESDSITAMLATVEKSHLATIVSRHAVQPNARLRIIPLESPTPVRTPGLVRLRSREVTPAEASFAAFVRQVTTQEDFQQLRRAKA